MLSSLTILSLAFAVVELAVAWNRYGEPDPPLLAMSLRSFPIGFILSYGYELVDASLHFIVERCASRRPFTAQCGPPSAARRTRG